MPSSTPPPAPRSLRILLVRHGETHENVSKIIQGQLDTSLNPFGHLQASTTGLHLSHTRIHRAISSPLKRAFDTANAIVSQQPPLSSGVKLKLETDDRLMERGFGVLEGKVYHGPRDKSESTDGIEKMHSLTERLAGLWNDLVSLPSHDSSSSQEGKEQRTVLLVSHGAAISALLNKVLVPGQYVTVSPGVEPSRLWNCSITEILFPTVPDRRPIIDKSSGDVSRKTKWTIRPSHLNVQGIQYLREYETLRRLLSEREANLSTRSSSDSSMEISIQSLRNNVEDTERTWIKDPKIKIKLQNDLLIGPDGETIENDIGFGKGIGCIVRWSDIGHLQAIKKVQDKVQDLEKSVVDVVDKGREKEADVNVDELVGDGK